MKWPLILLALFIPTPTYAEDYCDSAKTTYDMNECGDIHYGMEDKAMSIIYEKLILKAKQDDKNHMINNMSREKNLREAQRAWIKFRDENCEYEAMHIAYEGTMGGQILRGCLSGMSKERGLELQKMLKLQEAH